MRDREQSCNIYPSIPSLLLSIVLEPPSPLTFDLPPPSPKCSNHHLQLPKNAAPKRSPKVITKRPKSSPNPDPPLFVAASERRRFPLRPISDFHDPPQFVIPTSRATKLALTQLNRPSQSTGKSRSLATFLLAQNCRFLLRFPELLSSILRLEP